ncbi:hypothetical protein OH76DRAFT_1245634 [Lentinus brumalis]|uniref:Uncharacterized protein n=1 Tax=Lentinus brumalis TaxID=2498619 RepID=A0A371CRT5_9APHY|nr:hypothetical protein OH76DRAFT_1245634 [Polyporus brumalis]
MMTLSVSGHVSPSRTEKHVVTIQDNTRYPVNTMREAHGIAAFLAFSSPLETHTHEPSVLPSDSAITIASTVTDTTLSTVTSSLSSTDSSGATTTDTIIPSSSVSVTDTDRVGYGGCDGFGGGDGWHGHRHRRPHGHWNGSEQRCRASLDAAVRRHGRCAPGCPCRCGCGFVRWVWVMVSDGYGGRVFRRGWTFRVCCVYGVDFTCCEPYTRTGQ